MTTASDGSGRAASGDSTPYRVIHLDNDSAWERFAKTWIGPVEGNSPLASTIEAVRSRGCRTVVVENGYADLDQASEAEFWSREFPVPHTDVHRLHFFDVGFDEETFPICHQPGYLGYAILALPMGRVIRSFLRPPPCMSTSDDLGFQSDLRLAECSHCDIDSPELTAGMLALSSETVEIYGLDYPIVGVPFCGQDAWHLQCGHAAAWTCLYAAYLRGRAPRSTLKQVVDAGTTMVDVQRSVSASGTNLFQLQQIFTDRGMPAQVYTLEDLAKDERLNLGGVRKPAAISHTDQAIFGVVCNYLNSGFPVLAATDTHALTIIGWRRTGHPDGRIELLVSDADEIYGVVDSPSTHLDGWKYLMIPLPANVVLTGETVQHYVHTVLEDIRDYLNGKLEQVPDGLAAATATLQERFHAGELSLRVQLKRRQEYKCAVIATQQRPRETIEELVVLRLPDWVWVVEVQDRAARKLGESCVRAEFVFDTTSPDDSPQLCTGSVGATSWCNWPYDERDMAPTVIDASGSQHGDQPMWESQINKGSDEPVAILETKSDNDHDEHNAA